MIKPLIGFVRIALSPFEFYPQIVLICIIVECHIMEVSCGRSYRIVELVKLRHIERGLLRQVGEYDFTRLHRFLRFPILILMYKLTKTSLLTCLLNAIDSLKSPGLTLSDTVCPTKYSKPFE